MIGLTMLAGPDEEQLRVDLNAAKAALDAAYDACSRLEPESKAAYQAALERYVTALRRFSTVVVGTNGEG